MYNFVNNRVCNYPKEGQKRRKRGCYRQRCSK
nr:MAG TPA: hypothetical protein [Caudoviricetes sp.]